MHLSKRNCPPPWPLAPRPGWASAFCQVGANWGLVGSSRRDWRGINAGRGDRSASSVQLRRRDLAFRALFIGVWQCVLKESMTRPRATGPVIIPPLLGWFALSLADHLPEFYKPLKS